MVYSTAIILSHRIDPDNSLSEQTRGRVEKGIDLYLKNEVKTMTLSGGHADKEATMTHADAMNLYARKKVSPEDLFLERRSLDTVGQAIFSKRHVVVPKNWKKLIVVSHEYHIPRVEAIFNFVYGDNFYMQYVGVKDIPGDHRSVESEKKSIEAFLETFRGVSKGNDKDIFNALIERHPLYKDFR